MQSPVGARCPNCVGATRLPTFDVKPIFIARGLGSAVAAGVAVGALWGYLTGNGGFFGFFLIFLGMGLGYAVSEAVSAGTNRKRGTALQAVAIVGVIVAYLVHNLVIGIDLLPLGDIRGYVITLIAAFFAASRLKTF